MFGQNFNLFIAGFDRGCDACLRSKDNIGSSVIGLNDLIKLVENHDPSKVSISFVFNWEQTTDI